MIQRADVVQIAEGRVFDEECYECADIRVDMVRAPGFYAVFRPIGATSRRLDASTIFIGPFSTAKQAEGVSRGETS